MDPLPVLKNREKKKEKQKKGFWQMQDVPLTESGQFDDSSSVDITDVVWSSARGAKQLSDHPNSGTYLVQIANQNKRVIVKNSSEPAREMFLTRIARHLGVSAPPIRFVMTGQKEYQELLRSVRVTSPKPVILIMGFVEGVTLSALPQHPQIFKEYFCASPSSASSFVSPAKSCGKSYGVLRGIGRIMALDAFLNNWDRIPLVHDNGGNGGNVVFQVGKKKSFAQQNEDGGGGDDEDTSNRVEEEEDGGGELQGSLVAIDNALTGIRSSYGGGRPNPMYHAYLARVENVLQQLCQYGGEGKGGEEKKVGGEEKTNFSQSSQSSSFPRVCPLFESSLRVFKRWGISGWGETEKLAIQIGAAEMFVRLAKFDRFAEEKNEVVKLGPKYDVWFNADLERIDLEFIQDMHQMIKRYAEELERKYKPYYLA